MTEERSRAVAPHSPGSLSVTSRLAERTLADRAARNPHAITVLIVDDIPETRDHLTKLLGFEPDMLVVGAASTGIEGLELAHRLRPDVVLMDLIMPEMSGLTAMEILLERMPEVAVVMMSVQDDADYIRRAFRSGARKYLVKPFSSDDLTTAIRDARTHHAPERSGLSSTG
jgi:DNA-binding NarL/FixJ family response regulator